MRIIVTLAVNQPKRQLTVRYCSATGAPPMASHQFGDVGHNAARAICLETFPRTLDPREESISRQTPIAIVGSRIHVAQLRLTLVLFHSTNCCKLSQHRLEKYTSLLVSEVSRCARGRVMSLVHPNYSLGTAGITIAMSVYLPRNKPRRKHDKATQHRLAVGFQVRNHTTSLTRMSRHVPK